MGDVAIIKRGGGGGGSLGAQKKATIVVAYPSGSDCTVTGNGKTYSALDTSGAAAFVVDAGTWTVNATKGSDAKSQSVTVTAGGWVEVNLSFWDGTLFENGNTYDAHTGGWQVRAWKSESAWGTVKAPTMSIQEDGTMYIYQSGANTTGAVEIIKDIDLTAWNSFNVTVSKSSSSNSILSLSAVDRDAELWWTNGAAKKDVTAISTGTYSVDLSGVSGSYDLVVGCKTGVSSQTGTFKVYISKIWLA